MLGIQRAGETRTRELDKCGIKEMRNHLLNKIYPKDCLAFD